MKVSALHSLRASLKPESRPIDQCAMYPTLVPAQRPRSRKAWLEKAGSQSRPSGQKRTAHTPCTPAQRVFRRLG